jgi:hypothetical protein
MKIIIDKLQISDDDLITDVKSLWELNNILCINKSDRNIKYIGIKNKKRKHEHSEFFKLFPLDLNGFYYTFNLESLLNAFDIYKTGEIKLTIEI